MKQFFLMITLLTTSMLFSVNALAASSEVMWTDYDKYYDVKEGNFNKSKFKVSLTSKLEEHFSNLAASLPTDYVLKVNVTDVDLAGRINVASMNDTRIIKRMYPPRMNFSYQLLDSNGKVIKSESELVIRDTAFMTNLPAKYRNKSFGHEKKMIDDWFEANFNEMIISK